MKNLISLCLVVFSLVATAYSQETIKLLPPTDNGVSVIEALQNRKTSRSYSNKELSLQELSNLLWCANGENRPRTHKRTTPSAWNIKVIDIYVFLKSGVYIYNAEKHILNLYIAKDLRRNTGSQGYVGIAGVELVYVANYKRNNENSMKNKKFFATADASHISQNVYVYCASANLGTVIRDSVNRIELSKILRLDQTQAVILAQTVGYKKE